MLRREAAVVLDKYDSTIDPHDKWANIKLAGPWLAMMVMRYAEDKKKSK